MKRGIVILTNLELTALSNLATEINCKKQDLLQKIQPVVDKEPTVTHTIQMSVEDAETLLDYLPLPGSTTNSFLESARTKLQQFVASSRITDL